LWGPEDKWLRETLDPFLVTRGYDASVPRPYTADWLATSTSGSFETLNAWRRLTYLARDLERNSNHIKAFQRDARNNVLGHTGIKLQPQVMLLKGNRLNKTLNKQIKTEWNAFRRRGFYEVTEQWSGQTADEMCLARLLTDGGIFLRLHRGYNNKWRFAVQMMEVDVVNLWNNTTNTGTNNRITTGVETNPLGKPVAYWCWSYPQADLFANQAFGPQVRVPAEDIIHLWFPDGNRITAVRGITTYASSMLDLRMLQKYEEAAVVSARNSAAKMGFYERDPTAPRYTGQGQRPDGSIIEEITPGLICELPPGYKFVPFNPGAPDNIYPNFRKNLLRSICGGLGAQYTSVGNDWESINYSSSRAEKETENQNWRCLQRFLFEQLHQRVFEAWIECAVLAGTIDVPFSQVETIKSSVTWQPRGYPHVDPEKESMSALANIDGGLTTRRRELAELGIDYDEFLDEVEAERKELQRRQITFVNDFSKHPEVQASVENPAMTPAMSEQVAKEQQLQAPAEEEVAPVNRVTKVNGTPKSNGSRT
jgi:lambda family phage portal protein